MVLSGILVDTFGPVSLMLFRKICLGLLSEVKYVLEAFHFNAIKCNFFSEKYFRFYFCKDK